jgi:carboxymethylenebutenolidase
MFAGLEIRRPGVRARTALSALVAAAALAAGALPVPAAAGARPWPHFDAGCRRADFASPAGQVRAEACEPLQARAGHPAVVVLYGCGGFGSLDRGLAEQLPRIGVATLYVDYFWPTPPPSRRGWCGGGARSAFDTWRQEIVAAATAAGRLPGVAPGRIGVVGWSLGAALALVTAEDGDAPLGSAARPPRLFRALVSYSGGVFGPVLDGVGRLPPTLVLSAGSTDAVPLADALALHSALLAHRVPTSLYVYPHGSHSWPGAQGRAALRRTEAFLRRWLV